MGCLIVTYCYQRRYVMRCDGCRASRPRPAAAALWYCAAMRVKMARLEKPKSPNDGVLTMTRNTHLAPTGVGRRSAAGDDSLRGDRLGRRGEEGRSLWRRHGGHVRMARQDRRLGGRRPGKDEHRRSQADRDQPRPGCRRQRADRANRQHPEQGGARRRRGPRRVHGAQGLELGRLLPGPLRGPGARQLGRQETSSTATAAASIERYDEKAGRGYEGSPPRGQRQPRPGRVAIVRRDLPRPAVRRRRARRWPTPSSSKWSTTAW